MNVILFASYPRCGVHWMLNMIKAVTDKRRWSQEGKFQMYDKIPTVLKSHKLSFQIGDRLTKRIFYTYRHGKDAVLAYSKFLHYQEFHRGDHIVPYSENWLKDCIKKRGIAELWKDHVEGFHRLGEIPGHEFIATTFELVLADPIAELKRVLDFIEIFGDVRPRYEQIAHYVAKAPNESEIILGVKKERSTTGFVIGADSLVFGESTPEERLRVFTGRWRNFKYWTKEIDDLVNKKIGDTLEKYGYEL